MSGMYEDWQLDLIAKFERLADYEGKEIDADRGRSLLDIEEPLVRYRTPGSRQQTAL